MRSDRTNREWQQEVIPALTGSRGELSVRIRDLPCLVHKASGKRKYLTPDFGSQFLSALSTQFKDFEMVKEALMATSTKAAYVHLDDLPIIEVRLQGSVPSTASQFHSDLADAIISAFEEVDLLP